MIHIVTVVRNLLYEIKYVDMQGQPNMFRKTLHQGTACVNDFIWVT